jgi:hypothetical protein
MGRNGEAADALQGTPSGIFLPGALEEAVRLLRSAPANAPSPQSLLTNGILGFIYLYAGAPNQALDFYEGLAEAGSLAFGNFADFLWAPAYAPVRKTDRFKAYVRKAGMVDCWRAKGWPQWCHPTTATDFVCE